MSCRCATLSTYPSRGLHTSSEFVAGIPCARSAFDAGMKACSSLGTELWPCSGKLIDCRSAAGDEPRKLSVCKQMVRKMASVVGEHRSIPMTLTVRASGHHDQRHGCTAVVRGCACAPAVTFMSNQTSDGLLVPGFWRLIPQRSRL